MTQLHNSELTSAPLICTSASGAGSLVSTNPLYSGLRLRNSGSESKPSGLFLTGSGTSTENRYDWVSSLATSRGVSFIDVKR